MPLPDKGRTYCGEVTFIEDLSKFWFSPSERADDISLVESALKKADLKPANAWDLEKIYITRFSEDGQLYRCKIGKFSDGNDVEVFFIDFGNKEWKTLDSLYQSPTEIEKIEPLIIPVHTDYEPIPISTQDCAVLEGITSVQLTKDFYLRKCYDANKNRIRLKEHFGQPRMTKKTSKEKGNSKEDEETSPIAVKGAGKSNAAKSLSMSPDEEEINRKTCFPKDTRGLDEIVNVELGSTATEQSPKRPNTTNLASDNKEVEKMNSASTSKESAKPEAVIVSHVEAADTFWLNLVKESTELDILGERLNAEQTREPLNTPLNTADLLHTQYSADGMYYRCRILGPAGDDNCVKVHFVDYGNCEVKNLSSVFKIPDPLADPPPFGKRLTVVELSQLPDTVETRAELLAVLDTELTAVWESGAQGRLFAGDQTVDLAWLKSQSKVLAVMKMNDIDSVPPSDTKEDSEKRNDRLADTDCDRETNSTHKAQELAKKDVTESLKKTENELKPTERALNPAVHPADIESREADATKISPSRCSPPTSAADHNDDMKLTTKCINARNAEKKADIVGTHVAESKKVNLDTQNCEQREPPKKTCERETKPIEEERAKTVISTGKGNATTEAEQLPINADESEIRPCSSANTKPTMAVKETTSEQKEGTKQINISPKVSDKARAKDVPNQVLESIQRQPPACNQTTGTDAKLSQSSRETSPCLPNIPTQSANRVSVANPVARNFPETAAGVAQSGVAASAVVHGIQSNLAENMKIYSTAVQLQQEMGSPAGGRDLARRLLAIIIRDPVQFINHHIACRVVEKIVMVLDWMEVMHLIRVMVDHFVEMCVNQHGTYVVQTIMQSTIKAGLQALVNQLANPKVLNALIYCKEGSFAAQACLHHAMSNDTLYRMIQILLSQVVQVSCHASGTYFMQKFLHYLKERRVNEVRFLVKEILKNIRSLAISKFGIFVLRVVVNISEVDELLELGAWVRTNIHILFKDKTVTTLGCDVIEKLIIQGCGKGNSKITSFLTKFTEHLVNHQAPTEPLFIELATDSVAHKMCLLLAKSGLLTQSTNVKVAMAISSGIVKLKSNRFGLEVLEHFLSL